ncbi:MAG: LVIVD repeat-containing protein [Longimicrobiaceae bacterium]
MRSEPMVRARAACRTAALAAALLAAGVASAQAQGGTSADPRVGLKPGWSDAGQAIRNLELVSHRDRPQGFSNPSNGGDFAFLNADMAFVGNRLFLGGFNGFQVWDISNPAAPTLRKAFVCPGGQGDVSVHRNLLFVSVEETRGRTDCGGQGVQEAVSAARFRGVRIFDITDIDNPRQVGAVQTCRGSHTHTLLVPANDPANVYIYVAGTSPVRPAEELAGCSGRPPAEDPNTSYFRIEVIQVPVAAPQNARVVSGPRIFADSAGNPAGLWRGGMHGPGTQQTAVTNQCHDVTVYPELGLAAGACAGNGILLDIRDPVNPRRIDEVSDPNFAYWHSATFSNDGSKVLFSDEWGGGTQPRCRATDRPQWGADAIFTRESGKMRLAGYYKLPAAQTDLENCVAHNGSLIPVPGRDIMVQAWYQGGVSIFDFTHPGRPVEIAFFDRGPMSPEHLWLSGFWSAYWYNGLIYASEIGRGLDVFRLKPSELLSQNEIDAAGLVRMEVFNPQMQTKLTWPASFVVARAYVDQLVRDHGVQPSVSRRISSRLAAAERMRGAARRSALTALAAQLDRDAATAADAAQVRMLAGAVRDLARG